MNDGGWPPREASAIDVQYFLPGRNIRHCPRSPTGILIGFFTHGDYHVEKYWRRFRVCLAMNQRMAALLKKAGAKDVRVFRPGTDPPTRPIVFGVCARTVGSQRGRKGMPLIAAAVNAGYTLVACSPDDQALWPCPITHRTEDRAAFYAAIDYLLCTSVDEGGPMPVPEAIAHGVPVIVPRGIGWCDEFPGYRYNRDDPASLFALLKQLTTVPSWAQWVEDHRALFAELATR